MSKAAILALEDGTIFWGKSIGSDGISTGEVVFNTSITGYQEILTDPSYCHQIVTLTYPHVGNTGITELDDESDRIHLAGLIIRDLPIMASNWRKQKTLTEYLKERNIVAIAEIDTRQLTRLLRDKGALKGCIIATEELIDSQQAIKKAQDFLGLQNKDLAKEVSTKEAYQWEQGSWNLDSNTHTLPKTSEFKVVVYDFGVKRNILRLLTDRGCQLTVVPAQTPASKIIAMNPDGVFLSNGPGDPKACDYAIDAIKTLLTKKIPLFGICLGHQLLAIASGAKTEKMKTGHHGANHPVQDLNSKKVFITSQNHGFTVSKSNLPNHITITHKSLFDDTIQGLSLTDSSAFGFQGHPEASPGPQDITYLFDQFINNLIKNKT